VAISFIGGGNRRKPPTYRNSLINLITVAKHDLPAKKGSHSNSFFLKNPRVIVVVIVW
jgi:hypothetical protein